MPLPTLSYLILITTLRSKYYFFSSILQVIWLRHRWSDWLKVVLLANNILYGLPNLKGCALPFITLLNSSPNLPTVRFPNACEDPSAKRAQCKTQDVMPALLSMTKTKESRSLLTFSSHIIGPQFVAAITVFVLFTVELQHLGSLIKILLDPFQIIYQPITTCEEKARAVHVWDCCLAVRRVQVWQAKMYLLYRASLCPPDVWQGDLTTKNASGVQSFLQMALFAFRQRLSNIQTGKTLARAMAPPLTSSSAPWPKDSVLALELLRKFNSIVKHKKQTGLWASFCSSKKGVLRWLYLTSQSGWEHEAWRQSRNGSYQRSWKYTLSP